MTILNLNALKTARDFIQAHPGLVGLGAAIYALVFTAQSLAMAYAGAYAQGAAPLALVFTLLAFIVFVIVLAAWGRAVLAKPGAKITFGGDEARLLWVAVLIVILVFTVLGTAFLALAFMITGLALINVDANAEPPEGYFDIFALFGAGEWVVAITLITVYALFSLWLFLRLAVAYPATLDKGRIMVLSAWPVSGQRRAVEMIATCLLASVPGLVALFIISTVSNALMGASPAAAHAAGLEGTLMVNPVVFGGVAFVYGAVKMALIGAPSAAVLCALYNSWKTKTALFDPE